MNILLDATKAFDRAVADLQHSVPAHAFSVLHTHALSDTLAAKGYPVPRHCAVLEVCHAGVASRLLSRDTAVSLALPCRVAVFEHDQGTRLGTIAPTSIIAGLDVGPAMNEDAADVERTLHIILADAA